MSLNVGEQRSKSDFVNGYTCKEDRIIGVDS